MHSPKPLENTRIGLTSIFCWKYRVYRNSQNDILSCSASYEWFRILTSLSLQTIFNSVKWWWILSHITAVNDNKLYRLTVGSQTILHYFGVWGYVWAISPLPVQNLTSYSCSSTPISYVDDEISRVSLVVSEIWRGTDRQTTDRQTTDRRGDQNRRLSH